MVDQPRVRRRLTTPGTGPALPTVADGVAYLGDADGHVCAIDIVTGGLLWQSRHELRHGDGSAARSSVAALPAVSADLVLAEAGEQVFAHDRRTGQVRWSIPEISSHHATIVGGAVVVLHDLAAVAAYELSTGAKRWSSLEAVGGVDSHYGFGLLAAFAAVADGRLFLTEGFEGNHTHGGLHAFDVDSGALLWGFHETFVGCEHPGCEGDQLDVAPYHPVYARGLVWVVRDRWCDGDGTAALTLVGFDPQTGDEQVTLEEPAEMGLGGCFGAAPVFGTESIYCTSGDAVHAFEPGSGRLRWSRRFPAPVVATPLLAGQTLHLATEGGQVHAVDAATGEPRWDLALDEPTSWLPTVLGEYDEVPSPLSLTDGVLYAVTDEAVLALG
ncbi:outer membrane protein assembly factor BamB family protein [Catellatospora vulcania]|uniref:outer membrane protein assembly factor BamB family protein n=1 Tax=Catellatospora vulcania TaxID=1460450 RepID=UPI0012D49204|nr:PQQ-binding-like beta-propeller repeat protein [Catellatospora vulcania]